MTSHYDHDADRVDPVELVKSRAQGVGPEDKGWIALCPAHDDKRPSLRIDRGDDGRVLYVCRAGCGQDAVLDALGLTRADLFLKSDRRQTTASGSRSRSPRPAPATEASATEASGSDVPKLRVKWWDWEHPQPDGWRFVRAYDYHDVDGAFALQAGRFEYDCDGIHGKTFRQRRPEPGKPGHWLGKIGDVPRPLYQAAEVAVAVRDGRRVYVPEGEKDVESLRLIDLVATCNPMGAGKWKPEHTAALAGADVVILPDNDESGCKHAEHVAAALDGVAASVRVVDLPGLPPKGDVSDWIAAGGTRDALEALADCASPWEPAPADPVPEAEDEPPDRFDDVPPPDDEGATGRPAIRIGPDVATIVDTAEAALITFGAEIYQRTGSLVRVVREPARKLPEWVSRPPQTPIIETLPETRLWELMASAADWAVYDGRTEGWEPRRPPTWAAKTLCARGSWAFRVLEGVATTPFLRPDGTVCTRPGYDAATGILLELDGVDFGDVAERPTLEGARAAWGVLSEPFKEFPWVDKVTDHDAAVSAVLTLLARAAILGCIPLYGTTAPTPGSGKGLIADVVATIGTGRDVVKVPPVVDNEEEERKRYFTLCMEGAPVVMIDNVVTTLGSGALASLLTTREYSDRILGTNRTGRAPQRALWFASGNNLSYRADLARRVVTVRLDSGKERPEERTFERTDLLAWTKAHRPALVHAALTILRAYHCAGRPAHGGAPLGNYEEWDALIRGAVHWVSGHDVLAARSTICVANDADTRDLAAMYQTWHDIFGGLWRTLREVADYVAGELGERAPGDPPRDERAVTLRDALGALQSRFDGRTLNVKALGNVLRSRTGRPVAGLVLELDPDLKTAARWRVAQARPPQEGGLHGSTGVYPGGTRENGRVDEQRESGDFAGAGGGRPPETPSDPPAQIEVWQ